MTNKFFKTETITENDLFFVCYMIERVARKLHQPNKYVVDGLGYDELYRQLSLAPVLHSENPLKVENEWIEENHLAGGDFDVTKVRNDLDVHVPSATQMGKVYKRLIMSTMSKGDDWVQALVKVYSSPICKTLDNYNTSAFYEPAPVIARAYVTGAF